VAASTAASTAATTFFLRAQEVSSVPEIQFPNRSAYNDRDIAPSGRLAPRARKPSPIVFKAMAAPTNGEENNPMSSRISAGIWCKQ
jgi:hypothetical protein